MLRREAKNSFPRGLAGHAARLRPGRRDSGAYL